MTFESGRTDFVLLTLNIRGTAYALYKCSTTTTTTTNALAQKLVEVDRTGKYERTSLRRNANYGHV